MRNQLVAEGAVDRRHNQPPLGEEIADSLAPFRERQAEILETAKTAHIDDPVGAGQVADLIKIMREFEKDLDARREELKRPYLEACRAIDQGFGGLMHAVTQQRTDRLLPLLDAWLALNPPADDVLRGDMSMVRLRREIAFVIEDLGPLLDWMQANELAGPLAQAVRTIIGKYLRALGVEAVEAGIKIPGLTVLLERRATVL